MTNVKVEDCAFHELTPDVQECIDAAKAAERERCIALLNPSRAEAMLHCGEMTAGEWRTVCAVLGWMRERITS